MTELSEQALLAGLTADELAQLAALGTIRSYQPGQRIIAAAEPATSLFFLRSGVVHVKLPSGVRLATITAGMAFGEMALLETRRSADVIADKSRRPRSKCRWPSFSAFASSIRAPANASCAIWPSCSPTAWSSANTKVNLLTANQ